MRSYSLHIGWNPSSIYEQNHSPKIKKHSQLHELKLNAFLMHNKFFRGSPVFNLIFFIEKIAQKVVAS